MLKTNSITTITVATALIITLAQISIPIGPVPFSLLTVGIGLVASLLKPKEAVLSGVLYLILGAIGIPVFANFTAGLPVLLGPTGGYLWGILAYLLLTSLLVTKKQRSFFNLLLANLLGDAFLFILGVLGLHLFAKMDFQTAIKVGVLPFVLPDLIKIVIISSLTVPILNSLKNLHYFKN